MHQNRTEAYQKMRHTFLKYEKQYKVWVRQRMLFNQRYGDRYYYYPGANLAKKRMRAGQLLLDFPHVSFPEACEQIGGRQEPIWEFGLWKTPEDPYWEENLDKWRIYDRLRHFPKEIYYAIVETHEWSRIAFVPTTLIEQYIPEILEDIGRGLIF